MITVGIPKQFPVLLLNVGEGWRLLEPGEPLKPGDGYLAPDTDYWVGYDCRPDMFRGAGQPGSWYHILKNDTAHTWPWRRRTE